MEKVGHIPNGRGINSGFSSKVELDARVGCDDILRGGAV